MTATATARAQALLDRLDAALARADGEVELAAQSTHLGTLRFAGSRPTQSSDVDDVIVQARVARGRRVGVARTNGVDAAALAGVIAEATALAAAQPEDPGFAGFDDGARPTPACAPSWDAAVAAADAAARARLVAPAFAACARAGLEAAGLASLSEQAYAVATRAGCRRAHAATLAKLDVIAAAGEASGRASRVSARLDDVAGAAAALADEAVARAGRSRDPVELQPGAYDVILGAHAVAELVEWLALTSFGARAVADGSSALAGRGGARITGPITIYDDALAGEAHGPTRPFDAEGTPARRLMLLDDGMAGAPAEDRASAGAASTGHAPALADSGDDGPLPQHLGVAAGKDSLDGLFGRVERGLYVPRFHYVNGLVDPRRGLMTGMTRDGLQLVEHGHLGRAVRNLRWTEAVLEAFVRLDGITATRELVAASLGDACFVCPALLVRNWRFTGQSR